MKGTLIAGILPSRDSGTNGNSFGETNRCDLVTDGCLDEGDLEDK